MNQTKKNRGMWNLVYTSVNLMESIGNEIESTTIPLTATTEDEAIFEAKIRWQQILEEANTTWEEQKATWNNPPQSIFNDVPPNPRIVYSFPLF